MLFCHAPDQPATCPHKWTREVGARMNSTERKVAHDVLAGPELRALQSFFINMCREREGEIESGCFLGIFPLPSGREVQVCTLSFVAHSEVQHEETAQQVGIR